MLRHIEVVGHAALAFYAIAKGDALELAVQAVVPCVINTAQGLLMVTAFQYDHRPFVRAAIDHGMNFSFFIPGNNDRRVAYPAGAYVAAGWHFDFQAQVVPDRPPKNAFLFMGIYLGVGENLVRRP